MARLRLWPRREFAEADVTVNGRATVLVTGGTGFVGRWLVEALARGGERVRVLGRRPVVRWRGNTAIEQFRADVAEAGVIERAVEGVERVFHLATATSGDGNVYERVTVEGAKRLLNAVRAGGGGRVIFVSSLSVYDGAQMRDGAVIDENFPLERSPEARGPYARTKTEADLAAQAFLTDKTVRLTIVRPGLVYGPGTRNPLNGVAISLKGRAWVTLGIRRKELALIYIRDLIDALLEIEKLPNAVGQTYNLVGTKCPKGFEYIKCYRELTGDRRPFIDVPVRRLLPFATAADGVLRAMGRASTMRLKANRISRDVHYCAEKVRRHLGINPRTAYRDGLREACGLLT
jgi:2-alkyl-3-oxoalkanoate reductase